jgi:glutamate racemase
MRYYKKMSSVLVLIFIIGSCFYCSSKLTDDQKLENFFSKDSVTILVTDSGLGGVSVAADVVEGMKENSIFKKVDVIFFNAQPHIKSGYNKLETTEQKVQIFENALNAIEKEFSPDLILIGCNTLSVLYPLTLFSKKAEYPVIGIVETGVKLINDKLEPADNKKVIIFATKTTVEQGTHKKMLVDSGMETESIITQVCPSLAGSIERGSHSEETYGLIRKYVKSVTGKIAKDENEVFGSFNCTNYGYVSDIFAEVFEEEGYKIAEFLDPNSLMADFMFESEFTNRYTATEVNIRAVSQPELPGARIKSIANLIEKKSPQTSQALENYEFTPDFFEWKSIAER